MFAKDVPVKRRAVTGIPMQAMPKTIAQRWAEATRLEAVGQPQDALGQYRSILEDDRLQAAAWLRVSAIEQGAGDYVTARSAAMEAAHAVRTRREWKLLSYVTQRLLLFDERSRVSELIVAADWSDGEILAQSAVLSQHLWLVGDFTNALRLIDHAIPRARPSHLLHYSRANALRFCGHADEATVEYERSLALAPDYAVAHWSLAYHCKARPPTARLVRIRQAIEQSTKDSSQYAHLQYAMYKELDASGDSFNAWSALQEGTRVVRQTIRHDSDRERRGLSALRAAVGRGAAPSRILDASDNPVPIFIVGMPRTGTTVLERILGNHGQVTSGGELNDFHSALCLASGRFVGDALDESTISLLESIDLAEVGTCYLRRVRDRTDGHGYFVDKNPTNVFNAGYIAKALPSARIVCLHRNPMDACFSNLKELFSGNAYAYSYDLVELASHYLAFRSLCTHWQQVIGDQFMMVDYEKLVTVSDEVATEVMSFCGLPFEAGCVDLARNTTPVSTASSSQVREPLHAKGIGGWHPYAIALSPIRAIIEEALPGLRAEDVRAPVMPT